MIDFILEIPLGRPRRSIGELFIKRPGIVLELDHDSYEFEAWGDPIVGPGFAEALDREPAPAALLSLAKGHYYFILRHKPKGLLWVGNSQYGILPIYFHERGDSLMLSNNALDLGRFARVKRLSKRFILETSLFQYPLFDASPIEGVRLLPANSSIRVEPSGWRIVKHSRVADDFAAQPVSWKKAASGMGDAFLHSFASYLPPVSFAISLTGGFDGRTLVSAGLRSGASFSCFCFGADESPDMPIASRLAGAAGVPFMPINLDKEYVREDSLTCGLDFVRGASGAATFARAHYLHAARRLAPQTGYILTGDFGSELLRSAHVTGAVISPNLHRVFAAPNAEEAFRAVSASDSWRFLNRESFRREADSLREDLANLPCFAREYGGLTRNQRFYVYMLEEVFRKYFGAEIVNQFRCLRNRTPFLDRDFLKALFGTGLAGVCSGYFEHNPLKRYKGQVLYAHIIRRTYPAFGGMMTDKGYRPDDLLDFGGLARIFSHYARRRFRRPCVSADPFAVTRSFAANRDYFMSQEIDGKLFDIDRIGDEAQRGAGESVFIPLSLSVMKGWIER